MTAVDEAKSESRPFEADVAKLLHMMVHSVYSDKDVFLRELISNAADACEKLRYEAIANPKLIEGDPTIRITLNIDANNKCLTVEDNGIGASLSDDDRAFKQDAAHLLFDEARILDGDRPADPRLYSNRMARVLKRSLGKNAI